MQTGKSYWASGPLGPSQFQQQAWALPRNNRFQFPFYVLHINKRVERAGKCRRCKAERHTAGRCQQLVQQTTLELFNQQETDEQNRDGINVWATYKKTYKGHILQWLPVFLWYVANLTPQKYYITVCKQDVLPHYLAQEFQQDLRLSLFYCQKWEKAKEN